MRCIGASVIFCILSYLSIESAGSAPSDSAFSHLPFPGNENGEDDKEVGYDEVLEDHRRQIHKNIKQDKRGKGPPALKLPPRVLSLNVMVAGLSGLGKTTTCAALLESWQKSEHRSQSSVSRFTNESSTPGQRTVHVDPSRQYERYNPKDNTILRVRIIDTPGFGNRINIREAVHPLQQYISSCRERQYEAETSIEAAAKANQENVFTGDALVHVCVYFLPPGRLLEMDIDFLKRMQEQVVIVPIIAKADTLTDEELIRYREQIVELFEREDIVPYNFDHSLAEEVSPANATSTIRDFIRLTKTRRSYFSRGRKPGQPLALVSRDGLYSWGSVRSMDSKHSDLGLVRDLLLSQHTEMFVQLSKAKYGAYRAQEIRKRRTFNSVRQALSVALVLRALGVETMVLNTAIRTKRQVWQSAVDIWGKLRRAYRNSVKDGNEKRKKAAQISKTNKRSGLEDYLSTVDNKKKKVPQQSRKDDPATSRRGFFGFASKSSDTKPLSKKPKENLDLSSRGLRF